MSVYRTIFYLLCLLCSFWAGAAFGQKTLNEARPEIRLLMAERIPLQTADAEIDSAYQRAQVEIGLKAGILVPKIDSSLRTSLGKETYVLPADFFRVRVICKGTGSNRTFVKIADDPYTIEKLIATQPATYAWIHGAILTLWSASGGVEKIYVYYYAELTHLTTPAAVSDLPVKLRLAACYLAASILFNGQMKYDLAANFSNKADQLVGAYRAAVSAVGQFPREVQK